MADDQSTLGPTLQRYRSAAGLTQEELAERAQVSARTISDVERGVRPSVYRDTAARLAVALGLEGDGVRDFEQIARRGPHQMDVTPDGHLPVPKTALIGRERELEQILATLTDPALQLLTLTGPGGIGKTRLALEAASSAGPLFPDGVRFVSLATERDPALFVPILMRSVRADRAHGPALELLVAHLRHLRMLLVLDTFEHLLDAAPMLGELLAACPGISALVTSRSTLHLRGEREMVVAPLDFPTGDQDRSSPSVTLFLERAREARPDLAVTDPSALAAIAEICRRVEGVPLAIELAAARVKHLPLPALRDRLEHRLSILTGGPRDTAPRQQTMRDTIAWSYELLEPSRRPFFRALSVFEGGWDLEGAGAVAELEDIEVLAAITALVDESLASLVPTSEGLARYRMLDVVREFAADRAADEAETDALRRRHAEHFLALAERAEMNLGGGEQATWYRRLESDLGNLRAATRWAIDTGDAAVAVSLAGALWQFWRLYGGFTEGRRWLDAAIAMEGAGETDGMPKALWGAAWLAYHQDDFVRAGSLGQELVDTARNRDLPLDVRNGLTVLGMVAVAEGRFPDALELFRRSAEICTAAGAPWHLATSLFNLGQAALLTEDRAEAERLWKESLAAYRELGDQHFSARLQGHLGYLALLDGDRESAAMCFADSLEAFRALGDDWGVAESMERSAALAAAYADDGRAATVAGAAEALRERLGARPMPFDRLLVDRYLGETRTRVGEERWRDVSNEGRRLTLDAAIDLASGGGRDPGSDQ